MLEAEALPSPPELDKPEREPGSPVKWRRIRIPKQTLAELNRRSDLKGFAQTLGYLGTMGATGSLFVWTCFHFLWAAPLALLIHGSVCAFLINGFHELVHDSVFKTRWLNRFFLNILSFLGWYNHIAFWASHTEHHKFTLHPPDDQEVVLPQQVELRNILKYGIVDLPGIRWSIQGTWFTATGRIHPGWETHLFTKIKPEMRPALHRWARIVLIGHGLIALASILTGWWPLILAISFGRFFGSGLQFLCNATQHIGLVDRYPDFRVACRTFLLNPVLQFLYWHMNYHTEYHMYAGVPCYNLAKLHRAVRHEMPTPTRGLIATWREIFAILDRQKREPDWQYVPEMPDPPEDQ
ncbi:MAG: fatty acid desaturase [Fimbriimonadaceae bacterium]|nr:fatty acid desaturase [Fimbriimonadaceae bacterium]